MRRQHVLRARLRSRSPPWTCLMLSLTAVAVMTLCHAAPLNIADEEPWRLESNKNKAMHLNSELQALKDAADAEAQAAQRERAVGNQKLEKADSETKQATKFMTRAERLVASERALRDEQVKVKDQLDDLAHEHESIRGWVSCAAEDCSADHRDDWVVADDGSKAAVAASDDMEGSSHSAAAKRILERLKRKKHSKSKKKKSKEPQAKPFDPGPVGKPYARHSWKDTKPQVDWARLKTGALKAGYDLTNCMVAAEKDPSTVEVRIMRMGKARVTWRGCTCASPWLLFPEKGASTGHLKESRHEIEYGGDKNKEICSMNGSRRPWCAVQGDDCGRKSTDPHAGHGPGMYGWTHWDYCSSKKRWHWLNKWKATHSAGEVTCLASMLLDSDRAAEWRALSLLRQEETHEGDVQMPPAQIASHYTKCIARATRADSAVFCEADLLRKLPSSVVHHALLISRSNEVDVHWFNRQRVALLLGKQLQRCIDAAEGVKQGVVCIAQLLSSFPRKPAQEAEANAVDAEEGGDPPQDVPVLSQRLVDCIRDGTDDDALAFCVTSFLAMVPRKTVRMAERMAEQTRRYGTAGFTGMHMHHWGDVNAGWEGFKDNTQADGKTMWGYYRTH